MGCIQAIDVNYFDFNEYSIEKELRNWEKSIGFFRNNFNSIYPLIQLDSRKTNNKAVLSSVLSRNYSNKFLSIIEDSYFKNKEDNSYNMTNINMLILLSSIHIVINPEVGRKTYCDKSLFLFNYINRNEDIQGISPIEKNNANLKELINQLVYISTIVIINSYNLSLNNNSTDNNKQNVFDNTEDNINNISNLIIDKLFSKGNEKLNTLSFDEFNDIFLSDANVIK